MINILDFGAVGDGVTLDTEAVQQALDCCRESGGTVLVPGGKTYKIGTIQIYSNTELHIESGAILRQSDRMEDLRSIAAVEKSDNETDIPSYINCEYNGRPAHYFIYATGENIRITGHGAIDGNEAVYYGTQTRYHIEGAWYPRTPLLYIEDVRHFTITGVTLQNSAFWTLHMVGCQDVLVDGIRILNNLKMANCDGIDPDHCQNVRIQNCYIESADDCIVLKTTEAEQKYGATENVMISGCILESTSAAIKFGTESEGDFRNILIDNCIIRKSNRGVALQLRDKGNIENVQIRNLMIETRNFIDQYWGNAEGIYITAEERHEGRPFGTIRNVRLENIQITGESGVFVYGSHPGHIEEISMKNLSVHLVKNSRWACDGYDIRPCDGEGLLTGKIYGAYISGAKNVSVENLNVEAEAGFSYGGEIFWDEAEA